MLIQYTNAETSNVTKMIQLQFNYRLFAGACMLGLTALSFAAQNPDESLTAYVDSVHEWGAWELGLQPAAGIGSSTSSRRAVTARVSNVQFRPNDNSAFTPDRRPIIQTTAMPTPLPPVPVVPTPVVPTPVVPTPVVPAPVVPVPAMPTSASAATGQPLPTGSPGDRFSRIR